MILREFRNNIKSRITRSWKRLANVFQNTRLAIKAWTKEKNMIFKLWLQKIKQKIILFYSAIIHKVKTVLIWITTKIRLLILWTKTKIKAFLRLIFRFLKQLPFYLQEFNYFAKSGKSWSVYLLLVLISFCFCDFRIHLILSELVNLNIYSLIRLDVDIELAVDLMKSSIGVIATIFSIAFVIIGFLISNLRAYKEDTYDMIYRNINLFPTLYISLTTIGFLIVLSLFRESFNPNTFINIAVWGTVLIILTLFLIGSLFSKVIEHIKPSNIYNYYFLEIKKIAKKVHHKFKVDKNRKRLDEMKVNLEERLVSASTNGDIDSLNHILSVYEEISQLDI